MELTSKYETVFIVNPELGEEAAKAMLEKFSGIITGNGGNIEKVDEWGKKKLAYEIDDQAEGYYVLYTFTSAPDFPAELDRVLKITEGVMRSLITVK